MDYAETGLADYFKALWPPREEAVSQALLRVFAEEEWSRVAGNDWRNTATGRFEAKFSELNRSPHCLAINNGTVALELGLLALGVRPGDEVIVPALSFVATATAVSAVGAVPRFVDVRREDLTLDPARVAEAVNGRTVGVIAVHLAGIPCQMDALVDICRRRGLFLLEDCSHAHGSAWDSKPVGNFGELGVFSLQQGKLITCGEGAVATMADAGLYRKLFSLQTFATSVSNGLVSEFETVVPRNSRLPNLLGGLLLPQLEMFEALQSRRRENIARLAEGLRDAPCLQPLRLDSRISGNTGYYVTFRYDPAANGGVPCGQFSDRLTSLGIPAFRGHNFPMYWRKPYQGGQVAFAKEDCPVSEEEAPRHYLNFRHELFLADAAVMDRVCRLIKKEISGRYD
jgi:3-amino-5-hydroxybenzoate synthase